MKSESKSADLRHIIAKIMGSPREISVLPQIYCVLSVAPPGFFIGGAKHNWGLGAEPQKIFLDHAL